VALTVGAAADGSRNDEGEDSAVATALTGDNAAFGRALDGCRNYLRMVAREELPRDLAAKLSTSDLVQETFLGAHRDIGGFRGRSAGELRAWLRGILVHQLSRVRRHYRATGRREIGREAASGGPGAAGASRGFVDDRPTPTTGAVRREQIEAVLAALRRLPEPYRSVVTLHQCEGMTFEAIGLALGRSEEATRKLWARALIRLTLELGPRHDPRL